MRDAGTRDDPLRDRRESRFASRVGIGVRQFRARNLRTQITRPPLCERTYGFRLPHGLIRRNPTQLRLPPKGGANLPPRRGGATIPLSKKFRTKFLRQGDRREYQRPSRVVLDDPIQIGSSRQPVRDAAYANSERINCPPRRGEARNLCDLRSQIYGSEPTKIRRRSHP